MSRGTADIRGTNRKDLEVIPRGHEATILGYACSCTPYTDHTGKRGDWREGRTESAAHRNSFEEGGSGNAVPRRVGTFGPGGKYPPPEVPRIEYHLDRWTPPPTRPAIILDSFGGTGTTAMVARALGRIGLSFDLSHAYSRAARWRIRYDAGKAISRTNLERQGQLL